MAIYSLNHKSIGKKTQARAYTAGAHIDYISRKKACSRLLGERMPTTAGKAKSWLQEQEDGDRKNARVVDKLMLALPIELSPKQHHALVADFAERATKGKASWLAAFHDKGKDQNNPHCHLVLRDRDVSTGKRVMLTTENGSTQAFRDLWEQVANEHLRGAGESARIDRRTLKAQGIEREPSIHEGVKGRQMEARGISPESQERVVRNGAKAHSESRVLDWQAIDGGVSRRAFNLALKESSQGLDSVRVDRTKKSTHHNGHEHILQGSIAGAVERLPHGGKARERENPPAMDRRGHGESQHHHSKRSIRRQRIAALGERSPERLEGRSPQRPNTSTAARGDGLRPGDPRIGEDRSASQRYFGGDQRHPGTGRYHSNHPLAKEAAMAVKERFELIRELEIKEQALAEEQDRKPFMPKAKEAQSQRLMILNGEIKYLKEQIERTPSPEQEARMEAEQQKEAMRGVERQRDAEREAEEQQYAQFLEQQAIEDAKSKKQESDRERLLRRRRERQKQQSQGQDESWEPDF